LLCSEAFSYYPVTSDKEIKKYRERSTENGYLVIKEQGQGQKCFSLSFKIRRIPADIEYGRGPYPFYRAPYSALGVGDRPPAPFFIQKMTKLDH